MNCKIALKDISLNIAQDGPQDGPAIVFAHPIGTNLHLWDGVVEHLPASLRVLRYDARGHGLSDAPAAPYSMGHLIGDAEQLLDALNIRDALFVGAGLGGLIAQGLAVKRLDQIRALALANTAAKLGIKSHWDAQIEAVRSNGMAAALPQFKERYFLRGSPDTCTPERWTEVLRSMDPEGYIGSCAAISGTDFYTPTSGLRLPCLGISCNDDQVTPPDLMRETIDLIPGSQFKLLRRCGHLAPAEAPELFAQTLAQFCTDIAHI